MALSNGKKMDPGEHDDERSSTQMESAVKVKQPETWSEIARAWPKTTFCIISNEFCERFSFYGMRTVLTLYALNVLKLDDNSATIFFHSFTVLSYSTPVLGSILADGYIGKFKTIMYISFVYAFGQVVLASSSTQNYESSVHPWLDIAGLLIIAFGTGGIKPCVSALGGDQFEQGQEKMLGLFFSMFYFSINAGALISVFGTPILRSQPCLGQDSCYPLAFGVPAVLMIVATIIFLAGSFWYKKLPPKENVFGEVFRVIKQALANKMNFSVKREHWLDHYLDSHSCEYDEKCQKLQHSKSKVTCQKRTFVEDVKSLFHVSVMLLPVPVFWALLDQQGSRWVIQAVQMDGRLWGNVALLPDQMQVLNGVFILVFIPFVQIVVYPIVGKCITLTPLRKMVAGGLLAAAAFVISAMVQFRVNTTLPDIPADNQAFVSFINTYDQCQLNIMPMTDGSLGNKTVAPHSSLIDDKVQNLAQVYRLSVPGSGQFSWSLTMTPANSSSFGCPQDAQLFTSNLKKKSEKIENSYYIVVGRGGAYQANAVSDKPTDGNGEFSLSMNMATNQQYTGNLVLCKKKDYDDNKDHPCDPNSNGDFYYWQNDYNDGTDDYMAMSTQGWMNGGQNVTIYDYKPVRPGIWYLYRMYGIAKDVNKQTPDRAQLNVTKVDGITLEIEGQGGVYVLVITNGDNNNLTQTLHTVVPQNEVSILWQVPQLIVITAAEILFSVTGYEFAYSQSAPSMKSLVQAIWLLTIAGGDLIIIVITALALFTNIAYEMLFYAGIMILLIGVFALIAFFYYEYNYYTAEEKQEEQEPNKNGTTMRSSTDEGKKNEAFEME